MRYAFVLLIMIVALSSCSYEHSFEQSWNEVGEENLAIIASEISIACDLDTWNEENRSVIEENASLHESCLERNAPHAMLIPHHTRGTRDDSYEPEHIWYGERSGWVTYADFIGSFAGFTERVGRTDETSYIENTRSLNEPISMLLEEDEQLGHSAPDLLFFSYRPGFSWGIGHVGETLMIDDTTYSVSSDGWLFTVDDLALDMDTHVLTIGTSKYPFIVSEQTASVEDYLFSADSVIVRVRSPHTIEHITTTECGSRQESRVDGAIDVSFECIPEQFDVATSVGPTRFLRIDQTSFDQQAPQITSTEPSFAEVVAID